MDPQLDCSSQGIRKSCPVFLLLEGLLLTELLPCVNCVPGV